MSDSPFKQPTTGGGAYLKLDQYDGQLILFRPESVDQVPAYKEPTKMVEEVTALWVAFGPKDHDEVEGAKFKGATLVRQAKQALKDPDHPWVLGVLVKVPTKETKERLKIEYTPEAFAEARAAWLRDGAPSGQEPKHAWTLMEFDEKQAERAGKYVKAWDKKNNTNPFSQPAAD